MVTIKLIDDGFDRYTLVSDSYVLGRMYDHCAEEIIIEKPEVEQNSVCTMIVKTIDGEILDYIAVGNAPISPTNFLSQNKVVQLGFSFERQDHSVKNSEYKRFEFLKAFEPYGNVPVSPEQEQNINFLISKGFVNAEYEDNKLKFENINGEIVDEVEIGTDLSDYYTKTEVDEKNSETLAESKEYTDEKVEEIKNNPDVVDIVQTKADLLAYDTSTLGNNDIIRVLTDETQDNKSSFYQWNKSTETWTLKGTIDSGMQFYEVTYSNGTFKHNGEPLDYEQLVDKFNDNAFFLYLTYLNLVYIPSIDTDDALAFSVAWTRKENLANNEKYDQPYISRVIINNQNVVHTEQIGSQSKELLLGNFDEYEDYVEEYGETIANQYFAKYYPTALAVKRYVENNFSQATNLVNGEGQYSLVQKVAPSTTTDPNNYANGKEAVALGRYNIATGDRSMAVNYDNKNYGKWSFTANKSNRIGNKDGNQDDTQSDAVFGSGNIIEAGMEGFMSGAYNKNYEGNRFSLSGAYNENHTNVTRMSGYKNKALKEIKAVIPTGSGEGGGGTNPDTPPTEPETPFDYTSEVGYSDVAGNENEVFAMGGRTNGVAGKCYAPFGSTEGFWTKAGYLAEKERKDGYIYYKPQGLGAKAFGRATWAKDDFSLAGGEHSEALKKGANAIGYYTKANTEWGTAIGKHNVGKTNALFEVGNGTFGALHNALTVYEDGTIEDGSGSRLVNANKLSSELDAFKNNYIVPNYVSKRTYAQSFVYGGNLPWGDFIGITDKITGTTPESVSGKDYILKPDNKGRLLSQRAQFPDEQLSSDEPESDVWKIKAQLVAKGYVDSMFLKVYTTTVMNTSTLPSIQVPKLTAQQIGTIQTAISQGKEVTIDASYNGISNQFKVLESDHDGSVGGIRFTYYNNYLDYTLDGNTVVATYTAIGGGSSGSGGYHRHYISLRRDDRSTWFYFEVMLKKDTKFNTFVEFENYLYSVYSTRWISAVGHTSENVINRIGMAGSPSMGAPLFIFYNDSVNDYGDVQVFNGEVFSDLVLD